jgi:hypothetical protein
VRGRHTGSGHNFIDPRFDASDLVNARLSEAFRHLVREPLEHSQTPATAELGLDSSPAKVRDVEPSPLGSFVKRVRKVDVHSRHAH